MINTTRQKLKKNLGKIKARSDLMMLHTCNAVLQRANCTCDSPSEGLNSLIASLNWIFLASNSANMFSFDSVQMSDFNRLLNTYNI